MQVCQGLRVSHALCEISISGIECFLSASLGYGIRPLVSIRVALGARNQMDAILPSNSIGLF
jgi:hypothetical protein